MSLDITTRIASFAEIELLLQWAGEEGWNPGVADASLFHATDSGGFFISTVGGQAVAGISLVRHTAQNVFLGLYICRPDYRGSGAGIATWNAAMATLGDQSDGCSDGQNNNCNTQQSIGLDGVVDQQENYRKSGFVYHFGNRRYSGALNIAQLQQLPDHLDSRLKIQQVGTEKAAQIIEYDGAIAGFKRDRFIGAWLQPDSSRYTFTATVDGQIAGIAGVRKCLLGYKVGPLLADSKEIAMQLLGAVSAITQQQNIMLDVPEINLPAIEVAEQLALQPVFSTARMYRGSAPAMDVQRLFGVATLELG